MEIKEGIERRMKMVDKLLASLNSFFGVINLTKYCDDFRPLIHKT